MESPVFYICGGIAVGKSTVLAHLASCGMAVVPEPVDAWCRTGMLAGMYRTQQLGPGDAPDPATDLDTAAFQVVALITRYTALSTAIHASVPETPLCVERSLGEDRDVFADATIPPGVSRRAYELAWGQLGASTPAHTPHYIYLKCSAATMCARVKKRSREAESGVPDAYIRKIAERYATWADALPRAHVTVIDAERSPDHVAAKVAMHIMRATGRPRNGDATAPPSGRC